MRINRKIVVSLNIRTSKDGKYCAYDCQFEDMYGGCELYGSLLKCTEDGDMIRHPKCIKDEVSEDYYEKRKK